MDLKQKLLQYGSEDIYPMHMPGHKRNLNMVSMGEPYAIDITEIHGFDDLHDAKGALAHGMERAAKLFGSEETYYLVNGSSCGILAAITASVEKGDAVLVARNCHKSVYHALELYHLEPRYILPSMDDAFGICGSIMPEDIASALQRHPEVKAVILTSPTYEGIVSDVEAIASIVHGYGIPLIVDEAHGAHFSFSDMFPKSALRLGADLVVQSLHKTLPSLTQTAVLHCNGNLVDRTKLHHRLDIFQSSSPSYIFMTSIDQCVSLLETQGPALFQAYEERLLRFSGNLVDLNHLRILCKGRDRREAHRAIFQYDPGKIVISCGGTLRDGQAFFGPDLVKILREQYRIELEMASSDYAVAMTSIADSDEGFQRLETALREIDKTLENRAAGNCNIQPLPVPEVVLPIAKTELHQSHFMPFRETLGNVSVEYVYAYPPGVPLLAPGERISHEVTAAVEALSDHGVNLCSTNRRMPKEISVLVDFTE